MTSNVVGPNPLFLRADELDRMMELLVLAERDLAARARAARERAQLDELDARILHLVRRQPELTMAGLVQLLGAAKQSVSRHILDLERRGLLVRGDKAGDRRARSLALSAAGETALAEIAEAGKRRLRRALLAAGPEAVEGFARVLVELSSRRAGGRAAA